MGLVLGSAGLELKWRRGYFFYFFAKAFFVLSIYLFPQGRVVG